MQFDPRLCLTDEVASGILDDAVPDGTAFLSDAYSFPLVAEYREGSRFLRAATGDEVTALLTTGGFPREEGIDWPGDPAVAADRNVDWQINPEDVPTAEAGCRLWAGEVLLSSGQGVAGPFYIHEMAARAWAFSEALNLPEEEVFGAQIVPYICARSFAPALLRQGEAAYRGFRRRYAIAPVRPGGAPAVIALPGRSPVA